MHFPDVRRATESFGAGYGDSVGLSARFVPVPRHFMRLGVGFEPAQQL